MIAIVAIHQPTADVPPASAVVHLSTHTEHTCFVVDPRVRVCLDHDTDVALVDLVPAHRRIQIDRGRVVVSVERPSTAGSFTVATRSGSVSSIKPGIFAVDVSSVAVRARVIHGTVALDAGMFVTDHELYDLVTSQRTLTSPLDEQADLALLDFETGSD